MLKVRCMVAVFHSNENNALIRKREFVDFVDHTSDAISGYRDCFRHFCVPPMCCCLFVCLFVCIYYMWFVWWRQVLGQFIFVV